MLRIEHDSLLLGNRRLPATSEEAVAVRDSLGRLGVMGLAAPC